MNRVRVIAREVSFAILVAVLSISAMAMVADAPPSHRAANAAEVPQ